MLARGSYFILMLDAAWERLEFVQYFHYPIWIDENEVSLRLPARVVV
jgi:hypothetical protein